MSFSKIKSVKPADGIVPKYGPQTAGVYWDKTAARMKVDPDGTAREIVETAATQTLTNKTLTSPTVNTPTVSGGTFTDPAFAGDKQIKWATVALTNAEVKALRATPKEIVPAVTGKVLVPLFGFVELHYGGTNAFTSQASDNITVKLKDGTTTSLLTGGVQALIQATAHALGLLTPVAASNVSSANGKGTALVLHNPTAGEISGNAAEDNTIKVTLAYYELTPVD